MCEVTKLTVNKCCFYIYLAFTTVAILAITLGLFRLLLL